ncbi:MAG: hypothetical protein MUE85_23685 [Microscillaceae bacterium]|jgi:hypothetical protein|nr:hypothetical protein [Microscillaceae bacterium]
MNTPQLQKQNYQEKEYKSLIIKALKAKPQGASLSEVVVATGLPTEWADYTLRQLLNDFPAYLEINEQRELIYKFDFSPQEKSLWENAQAGIAWVLQLLWQIFTFGFKFWIVLMLFTYLLFNALVLLAAIIGITRSGDLLEGAFRLFGGGVQELWKMIWRTDRTKNGVIHQVFSYVFGQSNPQTGKLALEKLILRQISQQNGVLLVSDIVQLTGWSVREAQNQAAKLLANYQGDAEVTDEGIIVYKFPELAQKSASDQAAKPIWERLIPNVKMNDNEKSVNRAIMGVNAFNIVMAFVSTFIIQLYLFEDTTMPEWIILFSLMIPLIFSIIFFLIPLGRMPFVFWANQKIDRQNRAYIILGEIFKRLPQAIYPQQFIPDIDKRISQKAIDQTRELFNAQTIALEADSLIDMGGKSYFDFEQINRELAWKLGK